MEQQSLRQSSSLINAVCCSELSSARGFCPFLGLYLHATITDFQTFLVQQFKVLISGAFAGGWRAVAGKLARTEPIS